MDFSLNELDEILTLLNYRMKIILIALEFLPSSQLKIKADELEVIRSTIIKIKAYKLTYIER